MRHLLTLSLALAITACTTDSRDQQPSTPQPPAGNGATVTAIDDYRTIDKNTLIEIDVLTNDQSTNSNDPALLSTFDTSSQQGGRVSLNGQGTEIRSDDKLFYRPAEDFAGADAFTYAIKNADGSSRSSATVYITVAGATVTANDDSAATGQGQAKEIDVLTNDSSSDASAVFLESASSPSAEGGIIAINTQGTTDKSDDTVTYTPAAVFTGVDSFTYTVSNSDNAQDSATVTVNVVATDDVAAEADDFELYKGGRGAPIEFSTLIANDFTGSAAVTAIEIPANTSGGGSLMIEDQETADLSDDVIRYTPADNVGESDTFEYTVTNGDAKSDTATVTITLADPESCDTNITKREASGLGWCFETYFDSVDEGTATPEDGTNIAIQVFVPHPWHQRELTKQNGATLAPGEPGFTPLFIHSHGFGGNKQEDFQDPTKLDEAADPDTFLDNQVSRTLWEEGYNVISYTQRGFGGTPATGGDTIASEDSIGILAPNKEGFDFVRLVDWAICHYRENAPLRGEATTEQNSDPEFDNCGTNWGRSLIATDSVDRLTSFDDNPALGTTGYSYGGGFQFLAQSIDPRVNAIMPMGTWHDLRYALHPNDTPKFTWMTIMQQFAGVTPGLGGGNGQPLPTILVTGIAEATPANPNQFDPTHADAPYVKDRQVSVENANILAPKGPVAWCDNNPDYYAAKYNVVGGEPEEYQLAHTPEHAKDAGGSVFPRQPRAHLFMIQGYGDTLFNYNEGYDNARCFDEAGGLDVRFLAQTSGHPFPTVPGLIPEGSIPPHYASSDTGMYLDEVVHCGVDGSGQPVRYNMVEVAKQWFGHHLSNYLPSHITDPADIFPNACITQTNVDPDYQIDENDPFYNGTNATATGFKYSREGAVFDSVSDTPVGHSHYTPTATDGTDGNGNFTFDDFSLTTGVASGTLPQATPQMLYTASNPNGEVLAGIPLVHLEVTRPVIPIPGVPALDEMFFVGTYVKRCQLDPDDTEFDGSGAPNNCDDANPVELLHFQVTPVRPFPNEGAPTDTAHATAHYPQADPRNFAGDDNKGSFYPVVWADNPEGLRPLDAGDGSVSSLSSLANPQGRLIGVSARLYPGDEVGLAFYPGHYAFLTMGTTPVGSVTIDGSVQLPLVGNAPDAPAEPNDPCILGTVAAANGSCGS